MADILKIDKINSLPHPLMARFYGGDELVVETICVETGCVRIDVMGMIDHKHFDEVSHLIDADGIYHEVDDFWIED